MSKYRVLTRKKIAGNLDQLPENIKKLLFLLIADLQADGPVQKRWKNFSALGNDRFHCHLTYHYVACWKCRKNEIIIEVYYVGSREKAPY